MKKEHVCTLNSKKLKISHIFSYRKYPNLARTQVEIISDPNYLVCILFER